MSRTRLYGRNVREHCVYLGRLALGAGLSFVALLLAIVTLLFSL